MTNRRRPLFNADRYLATSRERLAAHHVLSALEADLAARLGRVVEALELGPHAASAVLSAVARAAVDARAEVAQATDERADAELAELLGALAEPSPGGRSSLS